MKKKIASILACFLLVGCGQKPVEETKQDENEVLQQVEDKKDDMGEKTSQIAPSIIVKNSWDENSLHISQYDISIQNGENKKITDWSIEFEGPSDLDVRDFWNCIIDGKTIKPQPYNQQCEANGSILDIGIIAGTTSNDLIELKKTIVTFEDGSLLEVEGTPQLEVVMPEMNVLNSKEYGSAVGPLHVDGTKIKNENNEIVQLKGVSTHGLSWFGQYVNKEAFQTLKDDWNANVVRLAMYTYENGGYCTDGNKEQLKTLVKNGIDYATELGMYVIVDWHVLNEQSPLKYVEESKAFFKEISYEYKDYENIIYEICNEPINSDWSSVIKPYANQIIPIIRENDPNALIIVGTNTWSQDIDEVIGNQLDYDNILYTLHFYAGTHQQNLRDKLQKAIDAGIPAIISECSITDASGNGGINYQNANEWLEMINKNDLSFLCWSLCNKNESSALIKSSCDKLSGWSDEDLSETGLWFKKVISGK